MPISEATFERVALEDPDGKWELHCGRLRSKPGMTTRHNRTGGLLGFRLQQQLPLDHYLVSVDSAHIRISAIRTYIPDVAVIPRALAQRLDHEQPTSLEVYRDPLPLVVEIWSPSTGEEDRTEKLPGYQRRGDAEIWLLRPQERTLIASVRGPDGSYAEQVYHGGVVRPHALPGVAIDLNELFDL
jgi:Uma2 family endonuclease